MSDDDNNFSPPPPSHHGQAQPLPTVQQQGKHQPHAKTQAESFPLPGFTRVLHSKQQTDFARPAPPESYTHLAMDVVDTLHRLLVDLIVALRASKRARLKVAASRR